MGVIDSFTMKSWPEHFEYMERFRVPDLVGAGTARVLFVGDAPSRDEVSSEDIGERSPLRGVSGRQWWKELFRILGESPAVNPIPGRAQLQALCDRLKIQIIHAVQFPIDPKIKNHFGDAASPESYLGFAKGSGPVGYKAVFKNSKMEGPVGQAIQDLVKRLSLLDAEQIVCIGQDSKWFIDQALVLLPENSPLRKNPVIQVPHPSSWLRNEIYRRRALEALYPLLGTPVGHDGWKEEPAAWVRQGSGPMVRGGLRVIRGGTPT
ncbi:MAG: hypothetical protein JNL01_01995 [Bdellovibrionales bacterium]|nr:hypothetical protein [Bdellovibrionales bacterium]